MHLRLRSVQLQMYYVVICALWALGAEWGEWGAGRVQMARRLSRLRTYVRALMCDMLQVVMLVCNENKTAFQMRPGCFQLLPV